MGCFFSIYFIIVIFDFKREAKENFHSKNEETSQKLIGSMMNTLLRQSITQKSIPSIDGLQSPLLAQNNASFQFRMKLSKYTIQVTFAKLLSS